MLIRAYTGHVISLFSMCVCVCCCCCGRSIIERRERNAEKACRCQVAALQYLISSICLQRERECVWLGEGWECWEVSLQYLFMSTFKGLCVCVYKCEGGGKHALFKHYHYASPTCTI